MKDPKQFYTNRRDTYKAEVSHNKKHLLLLSWLRFSAFVVTVILAYYFFPNWKLSVIICAIGIALFIYLLTQYSSQNKQLELKKALLKLNEEDLKMLESKFHHRETGNEFQDPKHYYSPDIDLFGNGSFFQYLNRTQIPEGKRGLARLLKLNSVKNIRQKQEAIKELSAKPEWMQNYSATASLANIETPSRQIINWLQDHERFMPKTTKWFQLLFCTISIILLILAIFEVIPIDYFGYWLFVGLLITGRYLKKINKLSANSDRARDTFKHYSELLLQIENERFNSKLLKKKQEQIHSETKRASAIFAQFSRHLDALDNRNNLIGAIFGNGYLLLDLKNAFYVEKWISTYASKVEDWFDVISFFDVYNTLGTYTFNHPKHHFPELITPEREIIGREYVIDAKQLGHPLLNSSKRVNSDVSIDNHNFFIVTGANMAGKSTFLRTISLHIVMANIGLPVCAAYSKYQPIKLITSMRTTDSLTDESSYFFSELTRLKFIVDALEKDSYFIVLDEILKGTNSTDKAIGSKKFVEKLVAKKATGIVATHDLSLCTISNELEAVENYYFDAEIINNELHFDYKLKKGVCNNMNASFLLKKMDIV